MQHPFPRPKTVIRLRSKSVSEKQMVQTLPAPAEYELSFAGRFESSVNNSAGKHKIDFGGRPRAADDANIPRVKKFRGAADIYHRGKIGLLNEIKADGAAGCDFALRDNGRVVRSNVTLQNR